MSSRPGNDGGRQPAPPRDDEAPPPRRRGYQREGIGEAMTKSFIRAIASSLGRAIVRAVLGRGR
jgi:hypothetical protein